MSSENRNLQERSVSEKRAMSWSLIASMADTTWRMFVPSAVLVPLGLVADFKFHTAPWLTLLMLPVGLGLSVLLVKRLLEQTK